MPIVSVSFTLTTVKEEKGNFLLIDIVQQLICLFSSFFPHNFTHHFIDKRISALRSMRSAYHNSRSTEIIANESEGYFAGVHLKKNAPQPLNSCLIWPVQRIPKYTMLLRELQARVFFQKMLNSGTHMAQRVDLTQEFKILPCITMTACFYFSRKTGSMGSLCIPSRLI